MATRSNEETRIRVETAKDNMPQHMKEKKIFLNSLYLEI